MNITDDDKKLLEDLDLSNIPEEDKQAVLDTIDDRMSKRFIANLLLSMPEDKRTELEKKVEEMKGEDPQKIIEAIIDLHPDAKKVLEDSAKEIVEELKKKPAAGEEQKDSSSEARDVNSDQAKVEPQADQNPATTPNTQIDSPEEKTEATETKPDQEQKPAATQSQPPAAPSVSNDYYRP